MKIRSVNDLNNILSAELAWRKFELSVLNGQINKYEKTPTISQALLRSGVAILYAHWEGFIKASATAYLEYISNQSLCYGDLTIPYRVIGIKKRLNIVFFTDPNKAEGLVEVVDILVNKQGEKCQFESEKVIDTKSNLNSKVFKEIVCMLGFDYHFYETKEKLIDNSLLSFRNSIAHGKELYPNYEQFKELYKEILSLMDQFKTDLENATVLKSFMMQTT